MKGHAHVVGLALLGMIGVATAEDVGIGTGNPGTMYHSAGAALAKLGSEKTGLRTTIQPYASPTVFIPAVNTGDLQFGLGNVYEVLLAYEGKEFFAGRPNRELRAVATLFPLRNAIYVRKSSSLKKIADLKGRPMPDGYSSQKIIPPLLDAMYATAGLTRADMKPVQVANVVGGADALITGKVDGFFFALGSAKVREADAAVGGIRALQIDVTPEAVAALSKHFPGAYFRLEKPGPDNPGIVEPVHTMAYDAVIFASAKASEETVYRMVKAIYENKADLTASFAVFGLLEPQEMGKKSQLPHHPGAIKFYKEKGLWPPK